MKSHLALLLVAVTVATIDVSAIAQEKSWKGEKVLHAKPAKEIEFGDRIDNQQDSFPFSGNSWPYTVLDDRESRIRIYDGGREAWADKSQFVLIADAPAYFNRLVQAKPHDKWALGMRATAWMATGQLDKAIKDYDRLISLNENSASAYMKRGNAWREKKEYDKAIKDFDEAIRIEPTYIIAIINRGLTLNEKKEYDKAIKDFDEAIRRRPEHSVAFVGRGVAWYHKNEYAEAIKHFDEAVRLNPRDIIAFFNRGISRSNLKEYDRAIRDFDVAIRLDPKYADAFNSRGWCRYLMKDYDHALADYEFALKIEPKNAYAAGNRGLVFAAQKKYPQAVLAFEAALALKDAGYAPYNYAEFLASCREAKQRDGKRAVELAKKAVEIKGKDASWEVQAALAAAYAEVGDFEFAVSTQLAVLDDKTCIGDDREQQAKRLEGYRAKKPHRAE